MYNRDKLINEVQDGLDFQEWKLDPCTQKMLAQLEARAAEAREKLTEIDPHNRDEIYRTQNEVRVYKAMVAAIDAYIITGKNAESALETADADAPID